VQGPLSIKFERESRENRGKVKVSSGHGRVLPL
jgi:hypothetical protein